MATDDLDEGGKTIVIQSTLALLALVIVTYIDHAFEGGVQVCYFAHGIGHELTEMAIDGMIAQVNPAIFVGDIEAHDGGMPFCERLAMIFFDELACQFVVTEMLDVLLAFIIEDVREAFVEDERQDEIFEFGGIGCAANGAGGVPEPGFQG